jgi:hypothetical protein
MPPAAHIPGRTRRGQVESCPPDKLPLYLQTDEQKENRHQPVIDPVPDVQRADIDTEGRKVGVSKGGVGDQQSERCSRHQDDAARCFVVDNATKGAETNMRILGHRVPRKNSRWRPDQRYYLPTLKRGHPILLMHQRRLVRNRGDHRITMAAL